MRHPSILVLTVSFSLLLTSIANGQRERRRQFVEDLLKGLIESQLEKETRPDNYRPDYDQARPQPRPPQVPPEVSAAREGLSRVGVSISDLVRILQQESYATPGYRQPLAEAMHVKALTDALFRNSKGFGDMRLMQERYSSIDQMWRSLAHRMKQARGVSRRVLAAVDEVDLHINEMAKMIGLAPQIDRTELVRLTSTLSAEFRHLLEDVSYEMHHNNAKRRELLLKGRDLMTRLRESTALIDRGSYESIVEAWVTGQGGWRSYAAELRRLGNDRILRGVNRVEQTGRQINAALWLPVPLDRDYIRNVVSSIEVDLDRLSNAVTLKDMLTCQNPNAYLRTIREFQSACQTFSQSISRASSVEELVWDYRIFNVAWDEVVSQNRMFENPAVQRHLRTGSQSMAMLEQTFGTGLELCPDEVQQVIAEMGDLCNRTIQWVNRNISGAAHYSPQMQNDIRREVVGMQVSLHKLHTNFVGRQSNQVGLQELQAATRHWNQLKSLMNQCRDADKRAFREIRGELEPLFVKMQVVYSR